MTRAQRAGLVGLLALCAVVGLVPELSAGTFQVHVDAGGSDRIDTPVYVEVELPARLTTGRPELLTARVVRTDGGADPAKDRPQVGQLDAQPGKVRVWWILPALPAGQKATYEIDILPASQLKAGPTFVFRDQEGQHLDLLFDGRRVSRFMYAFDTSTRQARFVTYKPFTHIFDRAGKEVITNDHRQPYPHHRGIFIGWSRTRVSGPKLKGSFDSWHMGNCYQRVKGFKAKQAGPAFGRMVALVEWCTLKDQRFLAEERAITVYRQSGGEVLLDFVSTFATEHDQVRLEGDPEHAGCQFRAHSLVAKRGGETRYVHPPGMDPRRSPDMPWSSVSFALRESRFNVAHLNHPQNPKGTRYSAYRPYARFGAFPKATVTPGAPATLRYRYYIREGAEAALTVPEVQRLYADFATPPAVTLAR